MLPLLGHALKSFYGPFRLLESNAFLIAVGLYSGFLLTVVVLPKLFRFLPLDRGREFAVQSEKSKGKPTGAGIVMVTAFIVISLLVLPLDVRTGGILALAFLMSLSGFLDDRSSRPWSEYLKGAMDLVIAVAAGLVLCQGREASLWLPFTSLVFTVPPAVFTAVSAAVIWISVNSTNCSDGVDGLSGSLALVSLLSLGVILYIALGHSGVSEYLLLPHVADGAQWAIMAISLAGCLAAYLWFNAYPSSVLMGDSGSRTIGFIIGALVMVSGNPFLLVVLASMLLANGGTGLVKVALLRFMRIRIFKDTRFPLHDHLRENMKWSNAQVLLKFMILQVLLTSGFFIIFVKIR